MFLLIALFGPPGLKFVHFDLVDTFSCLTWRGTSFPSSTDSLFGKFVGEKSVAKEDNCGSTSPSCWRGLSTILEGTLVIVSVLALGLRRLLDIKWGASYCLGDVAALRGVVSIGRWSSRSTPFGIPSPPFSLLCVSDPRYFVFVFLCFFLGLGVTPRPNRFGIHTPSSLAFFVSLF